MPTSRKTTKAAMAAAAAMLSIPKELIDQFVTGPMSAEAVNAVDRRKVVTVATVKLSLGCGIGFA